MLCLMKEKLAKELSDDTSLYRIMPLERLLQMLVDKENVLVSPSLWDDPLELLVDDKLLEEVNHRHQIPEDAPIYKCIENNHKWYAQCWSYTEESDAMWRIYSHDKAQRCVRIETTFGKLQRSYRRYNGKDTEFFLKPVRYGRLNTGDYLEQAESVFDEDDAMQNMQLSIEACIHLLKHEAYRHENEVRLLAFVPNLKPVAKCYSYSINPVTLIKTIVLDPWTPKESVNAITTAIKKCAKTGKLKVERSDLYEKKQLVDKLFKSIYGEETGEQNERDKLINNH